jgi:cobalt-zinc-cadmium resistance protein CzcA
MADTGMDKAKLTDRSDQAVADEFPGVDFNFSQYIEDNVEEAASGVKGENSVKLFGNDLDMLQATAERDRQQVMAGVPGIADLAVFNSLGQPTVEIDIDRDMRAARYGLAPGDINAVVQAAIGGQAAGNLYEDGSDRNFPIMVRLAPQYRQSLDAIRRITVGAPNPRTATALCRFPCPTWPPSSWCRARPSSIAKTRNAIFPSNSRCAGATWAARCRMRSKDRRRKVKLPPGYRLEWVGEFGEFAGSDPAAGPRRAAQHGC